MKRNTQIVILALVLLMTANCRQQEGFYSNVFRSDVFVQAYEENKYDFLFVFDTSGSFKDRRDYVKDNMQTFLNILNSRKAVDYQMAVTTVDMFGGVAPALPDAAGVRGNLVAANSGLTVLKSTTSANPAADFAAIMTNIQQSDTAFWEQGLEAMYQAYFKHGSEFSREGVPLVIIPMSDATDYSCQDQCWGVEPENNDHWVPYSIDRYINYFQTIKKNENTDVVAFPIIGMPSGVCDVESTGSRYIALQTALGGYGRSASVCNADLADSFNGIARTIADRGNVFKLSNEASGTGIHVFIDQEIVPNTPDNYLYDANSNSIIFTGASPKKGSVIQITYDQKMN